MEQVRFKVGDRIRIVRMDGEPEYSGREGAPQGAPGRESQTND